MNKHMHKVQLYNGLLFPVGVVLLVVASGFLVIDYFSVRWLTQKHMCMQMWYTCSVVGFCQKPGTSGNEEEME